MYSQSPHFKKKDMPGSSSGDYRSGSPLCAVNLRPSASGSSLVSPSKSRRIRTSGRNKKDHHYSVENIEAAAPGFNTNHGLSALEALASPKISQTSQQKFFAANNLQGRSSSMTNVGLTGQDYASDQGDFDSISFGREGSLDRRGNRQYRHNSLNRDGNDGFSTFSGRDRSHDREYPVMGARSLERDHSNLHRSRSIDQEYILNQATYFPNQPEYIHTRETLIIDLQSQLADLNKECAILHQSVDTTKEKLNSSMNSIKTFWSPELKKERQLRKEESGRLNSVTEQYRLGIEENRRLSTKIRELENEVKHLQSSRATPPPASPCLASTGGGVGQSPTSTQQPPVPSPRRGDKNAKENKLLRKTIEEMELRIETQKQTLTARDSSIKKLLEMLQSRGVSSEQYEDDRAEIDRWRDKAIVEERRAEKLDCLLGQKEKELDYLNQVVLDQEKLQTTQSPDVNKRHSADLLTLEAMVETKDVKITRLESQLASLQSEVDRLREGVSGATLVTGSSTTPGTPTRSSGQLESEAWKQQEKTLKAKIESLKTEVSRQETSINTLQSQVTSSEMQAQDKEHLVSVLKEQVSAKEKQIGLLQADLSSLRSRVQDKESQLDSKGKTLISSQQELKKCHSQIMELKDQLELRQRRIVVLEKKVESLEDSLTEKDVALNSTQARLSTLQADRSSSNTTLDSLQETIAEKEQQILKLKGQRDQTEQEHQTEVDLQQRHLHELKNKLNMAEAQNIGKQEEISVLREELANFKHEALQQEVKFKQERDDGQRSAERLQSLRQEMEQLRESKSSESHAMVASLEQQITSLKEEVTRKEGEVTRTQNELDRLLDILKTTENEKNRKDDQIKELQEHIKEQKSKIGNLKKAQQDDKTKATQIMEEAQKRESNSNDDTSALKNILAQKEDRIEELEEALRESVRITAQREMVVHDLDVKIRQANMKVKTMVEELEHMKEHCKECAEEVTQLRDRLQEKGEILAELKSERNTHMLEVYDMKQEAILAAITEKDAHVALIEMAPNSGTAQTLQEVEGLTQEKQHLQRKLKDLTELRMKILAEEAAKSSPKKSLVSNGNSTQATVIEDNKKSSIWT